MICLGQKDCSKVQQVCRVSKMKRGMLVTCTWLVARAGFDVPPAVSLMTPLSCTKRTFSVRPHCPNGCNVCKGNWCVILPALATGHVAATDNPAVSRRSLYETPSCARKIICTCLSAPQALDTNHMQSPMRSCGHQHASRQPGFTSSGSMPGCAFTHPVHHRQQVWPMRGAHALASESYGDALVQPLAPFPTDMGPLPGPKEMTTMVEASHQLSQHTSCSPPARTHHPAMACVATKHLMSCAAC